MDFVPREARLSVRRQERLPGGSVLNPPGVLLAAVAGSEFTDDNFVVKSKLEIVVTYEQVRQRKEGIGVREFGR